MSSSSNTSRPFSAPMLEDDEVRGTPYDISDCDGFTDGNVGIGSGGSTQSTTAEYWSPLPVLGVLSKWTNLLHGWQERYFVLADGQLTYYRNAEEVKMGSRGSIRIRSAEINIHEDDDCRFEIHVGESIWYLRGASSTQRQTWIHAIERHRVAESGYGSERTLNRPTSLVSLNSSSAVHSPSLTSASSFKRSHRLVDKLAEMTTFKELLCKQVDTLQAYFDACSSIGQYVQQKESLSGPGTLPNVSDIEEDSASSRPITPPLYPIDNEAPATTGISTSRLGSSPSPTASDNGEGSAPKGADQVTTPASTGGFFSRFLSFRIAQTVSLPMTNRKPGSPANSKASGQQPTAEEPSDEQQTTVHSTKASSHPHQPLRLSRLKKMIAQHAVMAVDFRNEGLVFKATTAGILTNLSNTVELMQRRDEHWRRRLKSETERYRRLEEQHRALAQELRQLVGIGGVGSSLVNGITAAPGSPVLRASGGVPVLSAKSATLPARPTYSRGLAAVSGHEQPQPQHQQFCRQSIGNSSSGGGVGGRTHPFDFVGPDYQEGPNSPIRDEEFYDAIDAELDKIEQDQVRLEALKSVGKLLRSAQAMPSSHPLHEELESAIEHRLHLVDNADAFLPPGDRPGGGTVAQEACSEGAHGGEGSPYDDWKVITQEGDLVIYQRELETAEGVVLDPLQAVHRVPNVTAREMCTYFWDVQYRMDWEFTINQAPTVLEVCGDDTVVLHQLYKRVWPTTQRDAVYWSHIRQVNTRFPSAVEPGTSRTHQRSFSMDCSSSYLSLRQSDTCSGDLGRIGVPTAATATAGRPPKYPPLNAEDSDGVLDSWMVVNMSTKYREDRVPVSASPIIRLDLDVVLYCQTVLSPPVFSGGSLPRDRLATRLVYMANINPGGWVPATALRSLAHREYPRFLRQFSDYVQQKTAGKLPLL